MDWKERENKGESYRARKVRNNAETSIEYGEKTWTTGQSVRDLMQNHLDAETEKYYGRIIDTLIDPDAVSRLTEHQKTGLDGFLHKAYLLSLHAGNMTHESMESAIRNLQTIATRAQLPLKPEFLEEESGETVFSAHRFLDAVRPFSEEPPIVVYDVIDAKNGAPIGRVPYDTLATEEMYRETLPAGDFRYQIEGVTFADRGTGYDSQLTALYLSSKEGKKHQRGTYGEGGKLSQLHLLRGGAAMKMRSTYRVRNGEPDQEHTRTWQTRAKAEEGRLVSEGIEIEHKGDTETGSSVHVSLKAAREEFKKEFIDNIDPRTGGLARNFAAFDTARPFKYPTIHTDYSAGINMDGDGSVHYVQGIRVGSASENRSDHPWYSYDFLDKGILRGRDRNQVNELVGERIEFWWNYVNDTSFIDRLAYDAVHDSKRCSNQSPELRYLAKGLKQGNRSVERAFIKALDLNKDIPTVVLNDYERKYRYDDVKAYIEAKGSRVVATAAPIESEILSAWALSMRYYRYQVMSLEDVDKAKFEEERRLIEARQNLEETEKLETLRGLFADAVECVNRIARAAGVPAIAPSLQFAVEEHRSSEDPARLKDAGRPFMTCNGSLKTFIYADRLPDPPYRDPQAIQRRMEIYLLNSFKSHGGEFKNYYDWETEHMRGPERVLDTMLTTLVSKDADLMSAMPRDLGYEKNPDVVARIVKDIHEETLGKINEGLRVYAMTERSIGKSLTFDEAIEMLSEIEKTPFDRGGMIESTLKSRIYKRNDHMLTFWSLSDKVWRDVDLDVVEPTGSLLGFPLYALENGRCFAPVPMRDGGVLSVGQGAERSYVFFDGELPTHIGPRSTHMTSYYFTIGQGNIYIHPDGLFTCLHALEGRDNENITPQLREQIGAVLLKDYGEYAYYPGGTHAREGRMKEGIVATALSIEYGKNEWDYPVRVFQDIMQNHIDASEGAAGVRLSYEIERAGERSWVAEDGLTDQDEILGLRVEDNGEGYYSGDIATLGQSSKRSPLFAGKYGEGQKMVAAAALRNGLELSYESAVREGDELRAWSARATAQARKVMMGGEETEKQIVVFDARYAEAPSTTGSATILRMPPGASEKQKETWHEWVEIINPRLKDKQGFGGMARYVRQLRTPGSERVHSMGSISILLDEPGAVYENGLRIHAEAEAGRHLAFGWDVPEVVKTRERNAIDMKRLELYVQNFFAHVTDESVITALIAKAAESIKRFERTGRTRDLDTILNKVVPSSPLLQPLWAHIAQQQWPGRLAYSSDVLGGNSFVETNLVHLNRKDFLNVHRDDYRGLSKLLPDVEDVLRGIADTAMPVPQEALPALCTAVAAGAQVFFDMLERTLDTMEPAQAEAFSKLFENYEREAPLWGSSEAIAHLPKAIALAPIDSKFHGRADIQRIVLREDLLMPGEEAQLAEVIIHELAHKLSGKHDYTEDFVSILYEVAQHLAAKIFL